MRVGRRQAAERLRPVEAISVTLAETEKQEIDWLTCNNPQAREFLILWREYVHQIDDLIDGDAKGPEPMLNTFMLAAFVYTTPFFQAHMPALRQIAVNCTNAYADSVAWEKADGWKAQWADHYRHFASEMVLAVAAICGGYQHMRKISPLIREMGWNEHHDAKGNPI